MPNNTVISAKYHDSVKRNINAPCIEKRENGHRIVRFVPSVDCDFDCENCGFNPRVKERRLNKWKTKE